MVNVNVVFAKQKIPPAAIPGYVAAMRVSENIRELMEAKGWLQKDLAKAADIDPATISDYARGKTWPKAENLKKIADALGVPVSRLFEEEDEDRGKIDAVVVLDGLERLAGEIKELILQIQRLSGSKGGDEEEARIDVLGT